MRRFLRVPAYMRTDFWEVKGNQQKADYQKNNSLQEGQYQAKQSEDYENNPDSQNDNFFHLLLHKGSITQILFNSFFY